MLQFLFEFAKPMEEKVEAENGLTELQPWRMTDLGFSPRSSLSGYGEMGDVNMAMIE